MWRMTLVFLLAVALAVFGMGCPREDPMAPPREAPPEAVPPVEDPVDPRPPEEPEEPEEAED